MSLTLRISFPSFSLPPILFSVIADAKTQIRQALAAEAKAKAGKEKAPGHKSERINASAEWQKSLLSA